VGTILAARIALVIAVVAAITLVCFRVFPANEATVALAYLVAILFIAARWGLTESLTASVLAVTCFNYYFLPPIRTFTIADPQNWAALLAFLATSFTASHFSTQAKRRAQEAMDQRRDMERLYALSRSILLIDPSEPVPKQLALQIARSFDVAAVALYDRKSGEFFRAGPEDFLEADARLRQTAVEGTLFRDSNHHTVVTSVRLGAQPIGSLGIRGADISDSALQGLTNLVAIGLERLRAQEAASRAEAARQSDELKSTLLDALAHEFKTPLTSIKAASTALLAGTRLTSEQQRELLSIVDQETDRLSVLVTEAIQMARIEAGRVVLRRGENQVRDLIESVLDKLRSTTVERSIEVEIPQSLPPVWVDREMIEVALRQLIDNALKYSPPGSPISIAAGVREGGVLISVTDHGPGIPEKEQTRIFERFYRAEASRHQVPGAGLGLVIAREIIHAHGGEIWVESRPGDGSTFRFYVPAAQNRAAA